MATKLNMKNVVKVEGRKGNVPMYGSNGESYWNSTLKTNVLPVNKVVMRGTTIYEKDTLTASISVTLLANPSFTSQPPSGWKLPLCTNFTLTLAPSSGHTGAPTNILDSYISVQSISATINKKTYTATPIQLQNYYIGGGGSNLGNFINVPGSATVTALIYIPTGGTQTVTLKANHYKNGNRDDYIWTGSCTIPFNRAAFSYSTSVKNVTKTYIGSNSGVAH